MLGTFKIMRFITLLGLTVIAKCINTVEIQQWTGLLVTVMMIGLLVDVYELYLKSKKQ